MRARACQRIWHALIPMGNRELWAPPVPDGRRLGDTFLDGQDRVYVIVQEDPSAPLPEGWGLVSHEDGEVVIIEPPGLEDAGGEPAAGRLADPVQ